MGSLIAKSLLDDRIIDMPFSPVFWKLIFQKSVSIFDYNVLDP